MNAVSLVVSQAVGHGVRAREACRHRYRGALPTGMGSREWGRSPDMHFTRFVAWLSACAGLCVLAGWLIATQCLYQRLSQAAMQGAVVLQLWR
jgi:hypothetical protein